MAILQFATDVIVLRFVQKGVAVCQKEGVNH